MENKPAHHPRPEEDMSIKWFGLVALVFVSSLAVIPTAQAARPGFVFPDICCYFNDALVRTVVPPAAFPNEGLDNFYRVEGQTIFGVVAVAPGAAGYHGGHWAFHSVTWNVAPHLLTSEAAILAAAATGDVTITRHPENDFLCPIQS
jgi:O-antigen ligase